MALLFEILNGQFLFNIEEKAEEVEKEGHSNVIRIRAKQDCSAVLLTFFLQGQKM